MTTTEPQQPRRAGPRRHDDLVDAVTAAEECHHESQGTRTHALDVAPERVRILGGVNDIHWEESSDLSDLLFSQRGTFPQLPFSGEGGLVLIALDVDGTFDQIAVSPTPGRNDPSDLVEMMMTVRDVADDTARALDQVMTGKIRPCTHDLVRDPQDRAGERVEEVHR